jgi:peptidoglycan/LPS O-acetylase OafA/YrhL
MTDGSLPSISRQLDERDDNFNAIRLVCAFAILVSHYFPLRDGDEHAEPFMRLSGFCNIGKVVTYACFVISGLLVTRSYLQNPDVARYLLRRAMRILPPVWGVVAFCLVLGLALTKFSPSVYLRSGETWKFAANAALYPNHFSLAGVFPEFSAADPRNAVNGSLWVIAPLVLMYLAVPVLGSMKLLHRPVVLLAIALLMLAAWEVYEVKGIGVNSRFYKYHIWIEFIPHLGFFFLCGAAMATLRVPLHAGLFLLTIAIAAVCLRTRVGYLVLSLCIPYATLYLGMLRLPSLRLLNRAGVIAFGVYLYGWPVQQLFMRRWGSHLSGFEQLIYPCIAATLLGTISWFAIERMALKLKLKK